MRDYLTLSWARFSKDVASHTLQISKILSHPAPRAGDIVRLDASPKEGGEKGDGSLEVVARFPGGLDFGRGLVDINVGHLIEAELYLMADDCFPFSLLCGLFSSVLT